MAIEKKLIHFGKLADFEAQLAAGNILGYSIVFIQDANKIWTHGTYYDCSKREDVADKVVRTLYGLYGELTDEQRAYNVETYQMFFSSVLPPLVIVGPINAEYNIAALPSSGEPVSLTMKNIAREFGIITLQNVTLNSDGSVVSVGAPTVVPINCNLNEPQYARIYFTVGKDIEECNPCILGENGMRYFIDASHASNSESRGYLMEYNTFEKRYRILIDPSTYAITSTEEIPFGGSGGETLYTPITWAELRDLRDNKGLTTGMWYRITDYVTTTSQEGTRSAGHPFDILVLATSEDTLSEEAKAIRRKGEIVTSVALMGMTFYYKGSIVVDGVEWFEFECEDPDMGSAVSSSATPNVGDVVYPYFDGEIHTEESYPIKSVSEGENEYFLNIGENLNAWKVWYCLDNDRKRFPWAVAKTNKSIVVLMDETLTVNAEYAGTYVYENVLYHKWDAFVDGMSASFLTDKEDVQAGDIIPYLFVEGWGVMEAGETISSVLDGSDSEGFGVIYRLIDGNNNDVAYDFKNIQFVRKLTNGKMDLESGTEEYVFTFDLYIWSHVDYSSNFRCRSNIIRSYTYGLNSIVFLNRSDTYYCNNNTFDNDCINNTFGEGCISNTFDRYCEFNTFGDECTFNTFGNSCYNNTFGNQCRFNTFGNHCESNNFGDMCDRNTFGNDCKSNIFSSTCISNTFGNFCESNTFDIFVKNYKISSDIKDVHIGIRENNRDYETIVAYNSKGELKHYCGADIEIGSGGSGGSSDDMEAFIPLSRDFSDDFNNDYAR